MRSWEWNAKGWHSGVTDQIWLEAFLLLFMLQWIGLAINKPSLV